jgi:hypothetical protein
VVLVESYRRGEERTCMHVDACDFGFQLVGVISRWIFLCRARKGRKKKRRRDKTEYERV